mgnify:CR=1 FL=1
MKNEKYTNKLIIDIPIIRSEIKRQKIGIVKAKYLFLKLIIDNKATAVIGVKLGGCGINLEAVAIIIIPIIKCVLFNFKCPCNYMVLFPLILF